ncbi:hypothetical protein BU17DRAFT_91424 [Hysterangium stoloniferum]|nr:hypothetical protein BU17DRAFT_91424 [Hysterangium stoloniferum]
MSFVVARPSLSPAVQVTTIAYVMVQARPPTTNHHPRHLHSPCSMQCQTEDHDFSVKDISIVSLDFIRTTPNDHHVRDQGRGGQHALPHWPPPHPSLFLSLPPDSCHPSPLSNKRPHRDRGWGGGHALPHQPPPHLSSHTHTLSRSHTLLLSHSLALTLSHSHTLSHTHSLPVSTVLVSPPILHPPTRDRDVPHSHLCQWYSYRPSPS